MATRLNIYEQKIMIFMKANCKISGCILAPAGEQDGRQPHLPQLRPLHLHRPRQDRRRHQGHRLQVRHQAAQAAGTADGVSISILRRQSAKRCHNPGFQVKCAEIRCIIRTTPNATPAPHRLCLEVSHLANLLLML